MSTANTQYKIRQCSMCLEETNYFCLACTRCMCSQCRMKHWFNLNTTDHNVVKYREQFNYNHRLEVCAKHRNKDYRKYCEPCKRPVCSDCRAHEMQKAGYDTKRQQYSEMIQTIRSNAFFFRPDLLSDTKADIKTCQREFSLFQSKLLSKANRLINYVNKAVHHVDFKHSCSKQTKQMKRHIRSIQTYEHANEQPSHLEFLMSIKKLCNPLHLSCHCALSTTKLIIKKNVIESLTEIKISCRENRRVKYEHFMKLISPPEFHKSIEVSGIDYFDKISLVTTDLIWVSDRINLILTNIKGDTLHHIYLQDLCGSVIDFCPANNGNELIYIDVNSRIKKLSNGMKTTTSFIEGKNNDCHPRSVFWSASTENLLVGWSLDKEYTYNGKVTRYNQTGQLIQTIMHDNEGLKIYKMPRKITENNNGDIVVTDVGAVVVTDIEGRFRFSYTGHPSRSGLEPQGICTDHLSHILVCDDITNTVQIVDKNGQFLSNLLIRPSGIFRPYSLSYDFNTYRLLVGSALRYNNKMSVYRHITRVDARNATADESESLNEMQSRKVENPLGGKNCLLEIMSTPKLESFTVKDINHCRHISCVASHKIWASEQKNLILTSIKGDTLHCVKKLCINDFSGVHAVTSKGELIYIDRDFNIIKTSMDLKSTTTFIQRTDFTWRFWCVYWSLSTDDLLVGMYRVYPEVGKVTRYNQSGHLAQTLQYDHDELELYHHPNYITENNNGDIVVSDFGILGSGAIVVTDRGGKFRFSYSGHPLGSHLQPRGICVDPLSHILLCDHLTSTVQMLDKDGQFLSYLLTKSFLSIKPLSLGYDVNKDLLLVGAHNKNTVCVYKYLIRKDNVTESHPDATDDRQLSRPETTFACNIDRFKCV